MRSALALRFLLSGAAVGTLCAAAASALAWWVRRPEFQGWSAALIVLGGLGGLLLALRKRWSNIEVALYLDAKLGSHEAISTAVELEPAIDADLRQPPATTTLVGTAGELVFRRASGALRNAPERVRPAVLQKQHVCLVIGLAALGALSALPARPGPRDVEAGTAPVRVHALAGLDRIMAIDQITPRDALQRERLARIANEAKRLRSDLKQGIERREAQARLAELRDALHSEHIDLSDGKNRPGLEAAISELQTSKATQSAAKALANADLVQFDREMQKLANSIEERQRKEAKLALTQAAKAAHDKGARQLAAALAEQQKLFEERAARAELLRELANALKNELDEQALSDLQEFGETGSPEAQKRLADAMARALSGLDERERQKLYEQLRKRLERGSSELSPLTREQLEELAKKLSSPDAQKQLSEALKRLAERDGSREAEREHALDEAERGGAEAERGLGAVPVPMPAEQAASGSQSSESAASGRAAQSGNSRDEGRGNHDGETQALSGDELRAKAHARLDPSAPLHEATIGSTPRTTTETARQKGVGAIGRSAPSELSGVEGSEVPEEYREQVGRYFQP